MERAVDSKIIQKRVDELCAAMLAKGMVTPKAELHIESNTQPGVYMRWTDKSEQFERATKWICADTVSEAFDEATKFISARPSAEQVRLNEFMRVLGKAIDIGNQYGIDAEYLNPLAASMKKLSENAITDQRAA